ncbi:MAG: hypothetical protein JF616_11585 [Fibrobacteres bacterium]|jgi:hypothetical protein|nr:hypothetical protein [Fibrobacterota bacterium]
MGFPLAAACLFSALAYAVPVRAGESRSVYDVTVNVTDAEKAKARLDAFVNEAQAAVRETQVHTESNSVPASANSSSFRVEGRSETRNSMLLNLTLSEPDFAKLNALLPQIGYVGSSTMQTIDNTDQLEKDSMELVFLREKKREYEKRMAAPDTSQDHHVSDNLLESIHSVERSIFDMQKNIANLSNTRGGILVRLNVQEESTSPSGTNLAFVNMPGVEYGLLRIENPEKGFTADVYQGAAIKYLFTRGKSFGMIGVYHAFDDSSDSTTVSELFFLSVGQDFYSRHFGRGANRFLNLYTGYTAGGVFLSGDDFSRWTWNMNPYLGLELFKNKNVLIDNKVGYFIPLRYTRKLRGLSYCASFNFVF